jgi:hypothetical protein
MSFCRGNQADRVKSPLAVDNSIQAEERWLDGFYRFPRSEEMDGLAPGDEAELSQREDTILVERRLKGKIETGQSLDGGKPAHTKCRFDSAVLAERQFSRMSIASSVSGGSWCCLGFAVPFARWSWQVATI